MYIVRNERGEIMARTPLLSKASAKAMRLTNETGECHEVKQDDSVTHIASGCGPVSLCGAIGAAFMGTFGGA